MCAVHLQCTTRHAAHTKHARTRDEQGPISTQSTYLPTPAVRSRHTIESNTTAHRASASHSTAETRAQRPCPSSVQDYRESLCAVVERPHHARAPRPLALAHHKLHVAHRRAEGLSGTIATCDQSPARAHAGLGCAGSRYISHARMGQPPHSTRHKQMQDVLRPTTSRRLHDVTRTCPREYALASDDVIEW